MDTLNVVLENCYGITKLDYEFDFRARIKGKNRAKAFAIYAPNGTMKSSFSKTLFDLQQEREPKEEVYQRQASWNVLVDGDEIDPTSIYVLKADIDIRSDSQAVTNILVNPDDKLEYDNLVVDLEKSKARVIAKLNKVSKLKKDLIEPTISKDLRARGLAEALELALKSQLEPMVDGLVYEQIFNDKAISVFESEEFLSRAKDFSRRYEELFADQGTIYRKGIFSPSKADASLRALKGQGYFDGGHRVHLEGDQSSLSETEFKDRLEELNKKVDGDAELKQLRTAISQNTQTQAISNLLEELPNEQIEFLIENITADNQPKLKRLLWASYIANTPEVNEYLGLLKQTEASIIEIEERASQSIDGWENAIKRFNERFVDMPFNLRLENPTDAVLGRSPAKLLFVFNDGRGQQVELERAQLKTLSQGEKRALYILNFIFDVEERLKSESDTLFIIDDVADSFDYKNKHAIVQYLHDLTASEFFHQIILTHNFDFYRAISILFVHRDRCLMTSKGEEEISLIRADGVKNVFINKWKSEVSQCDKILCASVPFVRNLIEYTRGEDDDDFIALTQVLHWKERSDQVTEGDFYKVWNQLFGTELDDSSQRVMSDVILDTASKIVRQDRYDGISLEDKVVLSIAIRLLAEKYMIEKIRVAIGSPGYWYQGLSQFGKLCGEFSRHINDDESQRVLEQVGVTVSSNIHLNSFMYEPILDLSIEHLTKLHVRVKELE